MAKDKPANLFTKSRYSLAEEDRVVNALGIVLQHLPEGALSGFLNRLSIPTAPNELPEFDDHVPVGPESLVDLVISVPQDR